MAEKNKFYKWIEKNEMEVIVILICSVDVVIGTAIAIGSEKASLNASNIFSEFFFFITFLVGFSLIVLGVIAAGTVIFNIN